MLRDLQNNRGVAMLIDQHLHSDAVSVEFFNRPAATTSALAALALRTGAPVIPVFALPLPGGRYRLIYDRPVPPPQTEGPDAIREFTQRCTDVLEMYVRRDPQSGSGCTVGGATRSRIPWNTRDDDAPGRAPARGFAELAG